MTVIKIARQDAVIDLIDYDIVAHRRPDGTCEPECCRIHYTHPRPYPLFNSRGLFYMAETENTHRLWRSDAHSKPYPLLSDHWYILPFPEKTLRHYLGHCAERGETALLTPDQFTYIAANFCELPETVPGKLHCVANYAAPPVPVIASVAEDSVPVAPALMTPLPSPARPRPDKDALHTGWADGSPSLPGSA